MGAVSGCYSTLGTSNQAVGWTSPHHNIPDGRGQRCVGGRAGEAQQLPEPRPAAAAKAADPEHPVRVLKRNLQLLRLAPWETDLREVLKLD